MCEIPPPSWIVSFPRSGHHWLMNLLGRAHSGNLTFDSTPPSGYPRITGHLSYCEHYGCCRKVPCARGAWLQKNHDFELALDVDPAHVVVLYREAPEAIVSWYTLNHRGEKRDDSKRETANLSAFWDKKLPYWLGFMRKWGAHPRALSYERLRREPRASLSLVGRWLGLELPHVLAAVSSSPCRERSPHHLTSHIVKGWERCDEARRWSEVLT